MKNIREKLKETNIRITELAYYLGISRPTLYSLIEQYTSNEHEKLEKKVYDLFIFIDNAKSLSKPIIMNYLITNEISKNVEVNDEKSTLIREIQKFQKSKSKKNINKLEIIEKIVLSNELDFIIVELNDFCNSTDDYNLEQFKAFLNIKRGDIKNG